MPSLPPRADTQEDATRILLQGFHEIVEGHLADGSLDWDSKKQRTLVECTRLISAINKLKRNYPRHDGPIETLGDPVYCAGVYANCVNGGTPTRPATTCAQTYYNCMCE